MPFLLAVALVVAVLGGCSTTITGTGSSVGGAAPTAGAEPSTEPVAAEDPENALPPGATPGLDDLNDDGEPDPTCGTHDYGAGLVLRTLCNAADYAQAPTEDTVLVPDSLYGQPGADVDLSEVSGTAVQARDADGKRRIILFINSDTLFDTGSADLSDPARLNLDGIARLVTRQWPGAPISIRGHTDSTGSPDANQRLSEQRATVTADYLGSHGLDRALLTSAGLGPTTPIVLETNQDGSPNPTGQSYNRRVELVVTVG